ncbi:MAG: porin family protein [Candidatus Limimorpha sp.]
MKKTLTLLLILLLTLNIKAQWSLGIKEGCDITSISRDNAGRIDEVYSSMAGNDIGVFVSYKFNGFFALRTDLSFMQRSHKTSRTLNYINKVYTEYRNSYLTLPVMADFSFGGERLKGHLFTGGYMGYWVSARRSGTSFWTTDYAIIFPDFDEKREFNAEDRRFNAGVCGGIGLGFDITERWGIQADAILYYDLISHKKGYLNLNDPRYLNTLSFTLGASYKF